MRTTAVKMSASRSPHLMLVRILCLSIWLAMNREVRAGPDYFQPWSRDQLLSHATAHGAPATMASPQRHAAAAFGIELRKPRNGTSDSHEPPRNASSVTPAMYAIPKFAVAEFAASLAPRY